MTVFNAHIKFALALGLAFAISACGGDITEPSAAPTPSTPVTGTSGSGTGTAGGASTPAPADATSTPAPAILAGASLYVDPYSKAASQANTWRSTRPADAAQMDKIAAQPVARWFGAWNTNVRADADAATTLISGKGAVPVFVAYNITNRDCGGWSGGGISDPNAYRKWVDDFAAGIGARKAVVILEPDALAAMDCLSASGRNERVALIAYAVQSFKTKGEGKIAVYIDAGNHKWHTATEIATRLKQAGIADATGFSLNVSNFFLTSNSVDYGTAVSQLVGGKHFVIDTSRNGLGSGAGDDYCNPSGRALGNKPTTNTGVALVDAYLWIKVPGESDGACNGGPASGSWWAEYALGLAQRAAY